MRVVLVVPYPDVTAFGPRVLSALLRERGILATPPPEQQAAFAALLEDLYR